MAHWLHGSSLYHGCDADGADDDDDVNGDGGHRSLKHMLKEKGIEVNETNTRTLVLLFIMVSLLVSNANMAHTIVYSCYYYNNNNYHHIRVSTTVCIGTYGYSHLRLLLSRHRVFLPRRWPASIGRLHSLAVGRLLTPISRTMSCPSMYAPCTTLSRWVQRGHCSILFDVYWLS